jgi:uncharacterized protein involved in high-affinity Fe2+ transport
MLEPGTTFYVDDKYKGMISSPIHADDFMHYGMKFHGYEHAELKPVGNAYRVYFYTVKPEEEVKSLNVNMQPGEMITITSCKQKYFVYIDREGVPKLSRPI